MNYRRLDAVRRRMIAVQIRAAFRLGLVQAYQPVPWLGIDVSDRDQSSWQRWEAIERELGNFNGSALDIGCNTGFFTFQLAQRGSLCIGIETAGMSFWLCNRIREATGLDRAGFLRFKLDADSVALLPRVDVTIFLSVFHHMVRDYGFPQAERIVEQLLARTNRVMFFETGQSDEEGPSWTGHLPLMDPDPETWLIEFFRSKGVGKVVPLGAYGTHLTPTKRTLLAVYP